VTAARHLAHAALALGVGVAAAFPAAAQDAGDDERFQIERVGEDVLRLDRQTGQVDLCARSTPTFVCRTVVLPPAPTVAPGNGAASGEVLAENQALRQENARLKRRLAMIAALVADAEAETPPDTLIPSAARREIDEALDVTTYAVRRFHDLFDTLTRDAPKQ